MKTPVYICAYLISNAFRTFCISLFLSTFFNNNKALHKFIPFLAFYIIISLEYIIIDIPVITMTFNLIGIYMLTHLYDADVKSRLLSTFFSYVLSFFSELPVGVFFNYISFPINRKGTYNSIAGTLCAPLVMFILVIIYSRMKHHSAIFFH